MKGKSDCHIPRDRARYEAIKYQPGKCEARRDIKGRRICILGGTECPQVWNEVPPCALYKAQG